MSLGSIPTHVIASEAWQSPKDRLLKIDTALAEPRNDVVDDEPRNDVGSK